MSIFRFLLMVFLLGSQWALAQSQATLYGKVTDEYGRPVDLMNVSVKEFNIGTSTDPSGYFTLKLPSDTTLSIVFSHIEFETTHKKVKLLAGESRKMDIKSQASRTTLGTVIVRNETERYSSVVRLNPKVLESLPNSSGGIEAIIKTLPGVVSNNELSSQYSVRGGNFDENLIYVNDVEIYKPQLIRSGEQEGLSFVNPDMVESLSFSAGGFEARYGDKMSSVLDIKYKRPRSFTSSISASLLGGSVYVAGAEKSRRFTHSTGVRYKTAQYLLNSLDTKGDYKPSYFDFQTYLSFDITENHQISLLGNMSRNAYHLIPQSRETTFGTINQALGLNVYFEGQEFDFYNTLLGAVTYEYHKKNRSIKTIASSYFTQERESYDILGQYYLNELNKDVGSDNVGDSLLNLGVGSYLDHARNAFDAMVYSFSVLGKEEKTKHTIQWGAKYQHESIADEINTWQVRDSAGFSLPFPDTVNYYPGFAPMLYSINSKNTLVSNRYSAYIQDTYTIRKDSVELYWILGVRTNYWNVNQEWLASPRTTLALKPNWKKDFMFRLSLGNYNQSPFYKEFRNDDGSLNLNQKAQQSYQVVLASDYNFTMRKRPFKLIGEVYYKYLQHIVPYSVENVLIHYYPNESAVGYASGIDLRLFGEFVPGIDSWASISFMKSAEDIDGDGHGYIVRPTDQRFNASVYFQDYLPNNPNYKIHLTMFYGTGLPFGPPNSPRYTHTGRMPDYFRTDVGFTAILKDEHSKKGQTGLFKQLKGVMLTAEIFNLMNKNNTVSYIWITDIENKQYAVPNYLTGIRLNVKLTIKL